MKKTILLALWLMFAISGAFAQKVTLIAPNGGETLVSGTPMAITWSYSGMSGNEQVLIALEGAADYGPIAYGKLSQGSHSWLAGQKMDGSFAKPASDYRIVIEVRDGNDVYDVTDAPFAIAPPSSIVSLMSPNGGETLEKGSDFDINWACAGSGGYVTLTLFRDNQPLGAIAENLPAAALRYTWRVGTPLKNNVPYPPGNTYSIQVHWQEQPLAEAARAAKAEAVVGASKTEDNSDGLFTISLGREKRPDPKMREREG